MDLKFYNTLTRTKEVLTPIDANNVRMYVCGPTVYDRPHIGNARSVVVYDVLFRLLTHTFGKDHVTYARNITDVDDKINARAKELGISIQQLTTEITAQFHADMAALGVLAPTFEPRATVHIPVMIAIIEQLLANAHAYEQNGHVLFDTQSVPHYTPEMGNDVKGYVYGMLSHRVQEDLHAGARVEVESYKQHAADFVLWKPAEEGDDPSSVFASPWGPGRPGWHIECSAMSSTYLGNSFDIHGGGADLMFPHHENEIAQSRCADKEASFAKLWVHNGFLTVNGEKMSKSLGNFVTVRDLLGDSTGLEEKKRGENVRLALLTTKYNEPLNWSAKLLEDAGKTLDKWYRQIPRTPSADVAPPDAFFEALADDLNLPKAMSLMHAASPEELYAMGRLIGIFCMSGEERFKGTQTISPSGIGSTTAFGTPAVSQETSYIDQQIALRIEAKKAKNWAEADRIRKALVDQGILLEDRPDGSTDWRKA